MGHSRRGFLRGALAIAGLGLASACDGSSLPWARSTKVRRIARLLPVGVREQAAPDGTVNAFQQALRDLGYVEGENLITDERVFEGADRVAELAPDVVRLEPEAIVVPAAGDARSVQAATTTIPIVSAGNGDLVASGVVANQARPEGNVTGLSTPFLGAKQLQLFREALPALARVAMLFDTSTGTYQGDAGRAPYETAARSLGLQIEFVGARDAAELAAAFDAVGRIGADGLLVLNGPVTTANLSRIADLALRARLPSLWQQYDGPARGGLLAYGPNRPDLFRRAAVYVDKLLKGVKPSALPIEQPAVFDFVVNLRTAQAIGLTLPGPILQQATELIQ